MNNFEQLPLRDIHLPDPVSWWPPAVGWWLLLVLAVLIALGAWWWLGRRAVRIRRRQLQRLVRLELDRIENEYKTTADAGKSLQEASMLLRRVVMTRFLRNRVAGLCGDQWAAWLRQNDAGNVLSEQSLRLLVDGPYMTDPTADVLTLLSNLRRWLNLVGGEETAT